MSWLKTFEDCACGFLVYSETLKCFSMCRGCCCLPPRETWPGPRRLELCLRLLKDLQKDWIRLRHSRCYSIYWLNSFARYLQCAAKSLWVVTLNPLVNCHHCPCWSCDFGRSPIFRHTHIVFYGSLCWNHQQKTRSSSEWASGCRSDLKPSPILPSTCGLYFFPKR